MMTTFFRSPNVIVFSLLIGLQGAAGYFLTARTEYAPAAKPLTSLSQNIAGWMMAKEWPMEPEVQAVLKADDTVSRQYVRSDLPQGVGLFIAFFRSQRSGVAPHSPKNCLPGNGWVAEKSTVIHIPVPGRAEPVEANYYLVQHGDNKSVVMYWYQSHGRTVADEYRAKFFVMSDAVRMNRTDTALVRVTVAVGPKGVNAAEETARQFVENFYTPIADILPR
jgi:EpsI family protein